MQKTLIPTPSQILTDDRFGHLATLLSSLNKSWKPHPGQEVVGKYIFQHGARRIFLENGRKWGKTEFCADICWRLGNMIQGGQGYYFGAYQKSVREFLWAPGRLQNHGPRDYVKEIHKTEMRLTFTSDTFIKLDGADEFRLSKGFNPDFVILDEFADYPEDFWPAMSPNFASKDAIVVIISSPPWLLENAPGEPVLFTRIADLWKRYMEEAHREKRRSKYIYLNRTSFDNERNLPSGFLQQEEIELKAMGLEDIWEREYLAKRVTGGGKRIIATYEKAKHMVPHDWLMSNKIERNRDILQWCTGVDPSQSAFGVLNIAVNPYSKEVYFLDEILEKQDTETTEHLLWPRIKEKEDELYPEEGHEPDSERWDRVCDEAAKWWIVGCANDPNININFHPTEKATHSIEFGLSLLRSIFRYNKAYVSDRCQWFGYYLENWRRDKKGNIPNTGKDLIDCGRYILHRLGYYLTEDDKKIIPKIHPREQRVRLRTPEQDMAETGDALYGNDPFMSQRIRGSDDEWMQ